MLTLIEAHCSKVTFVMSWNGGNGVMSALIDHRNARGVLNEPWVITAEDKPGHRR